ncbi:DedA family protein, partial [bacterium]
MPLPEFATLAGLFLTALVAATVFPGQSEALLVALLLAGGPPVPLVLAASTGNIAGSIVNWLLGRGLARFENRRWFPLKPAALARATRWYERFGKWSLLLSWAPIIGDPLT